MAAPDSRPAEEALVDLACQVKVYDRFRSEDPMEAARFVVSDAVAALLDRMLTRVDRTLTRDGSAAPAEHAMPQPPESRFGWTRTGFGAVSESEISLAPVIACLLRGPDAWAACADGYLEALDRLGRARSMQEGEIPATDPQGCVVSTRTAPFPSDLPISVLEPPRHTGLRLGRWYAVQAHGFLERLSDDVDLVTDTADAIAFSEGVDRLPRFSMNGSARDDPPNCVDREHPQAQATWPASVSPRPEQGTR
ncbi:hypothetical protein OG194_20665 [Streptomyces sp. NBC_01288]|uniref:hypothetical protein n=1 Tax=Streptomyces sp. NBC_01288 TaxID=2903814 RepID=UPI002E0E62F2|nr:hypothetical protein OG194_20665 [Streptomyces sp. NBC_01288]